MRKRLLVVVIILHGQHKAIGDLRKSRLFVDDRIVCEEKSTSAWFFVAFASQLPAIKNRMKDSKIHEDVMSMAAPRSFAALSWQKLKRL